MVVAVGGHSAPSFRHGHQATDVSAREREEEDPRATQTHEQKHNKQSTTIKFEEADPIGVNS